MNNKRVFCKSETMRCITMTSLALAASLVCLQPQAAFARDHDQNNQDSSQKGGSQGSQQSSGKGVSQTYHATQTFHAAGQGGNRVYNQSNNNAVVNHGSSGTIFQPHNTGAVSSQTVTSQNAWTHHDHNTGFQTHNAGVATSQAVTSQNAWIGNHNSNFQRHNSNIATSQAMASQNVWTGHNHNNNQQIQNEARFSPRGTRDNHYQGRWFAADSHRDWDHDGDHYWNHHHYRWYDGGWLIIDLNYAPDYATYDSVEVAVQQRLADQGYYDGPIDGDIGPMSSQAIANYQGDHGLRVTGDINDPLLESLGLE